MCQHCTEYYQIQHSDVERTSQTETVSFSNGTGAYGGAPVTQRAAYSTSNAEYSQQAYVSAVATDLRWTNTDSNGTTIVTFSFNPADQAAGYSDLRAFSAADQAATREILAQYAVHTNIRFVEVASGADITLYRGDLGDDRYAGMAYSSWYGRNAHGEFPLAKVDIIIGNNQSDFSFNADGSGSERVGYGRQVLVHEVGHALGLKHPGHYSSGDANGPHLPDSLDSQELTVMSYNIGGLTASTAMPLDILALQSMYGANTATNADDTVHMLDMGYQSQRSLWDAGGNDTLVLANHASLAHMTVSIDLRDGGHFSSDLAGYAQVYIPQGVMIEYALGNSSRDEIIGNAMANRLTGGLNSDTLFGGAGDDTLTGGRGSSDGDDASDVLYGQSGNDLIYANAGDDTVYGGTGQADPSDGNDTIYGGYGSDRIYANSGDDKVYGGGNGYDPNDLGDIIYGGFGADSLYGNGGDDTIYGGGAGYDPNDVGDWVFGGNGDDVLFGNGGNDTLDGGPGNDTLIGGAGDDVFVFGTASGTVTLSQFDGAGVDGGDVVQLAAALYASAQDAAASVLYENDMAWLDTGHGQRLVWANLDGQLWAEDFSIV